MRRKHEETKRTDMQCTYLEERDGRAVRRIAAAQAVQLAVPRGRVDGCACAEPRVRPVQDAPLAARHRRVKRYICWQGFRCGFASSSSSNRSGSWEVGGRLGGCVWREQEEGKKEKKKDTGESPRNLRVWPQKSKIKHVHDTHPKQAPQKQLLTRAEKNPRARPRAGRERRRAPCRCAWR